MAIATAASTSAARPTGNGEPPLVVTESRRGLEGGAMGVSIGGGDGDGDGDVVGCEPAVGDGDREGGGGGGGAGEGECAGGDGGAGEGECAGGEAGGAVGGGEVTAWLRAGDVPTQLGCGLPS
jgi:hypothetical protein